MSFENVWPHISYYTILKSIVAAWISHSAQQPCTGKHWTTHWEDQVKGPDMGQAHHIQMVQQREKKNLYKEIR